VIHKALRAVAHRAGFAAGIATYAAFSLVPEPRIALIKA